MGLLNKSIYATEEKKIKEAVSKRSAAIADVNSNMERVQNDLVKAQADLDEALAAGNEEAYADAKRAEQKAADIRDMYIRRKQSLDDGGIFSQEELDRVVEMIRAKQRSEMTTAAAKISDLIKQIDDITDSTNAVLDEGDSILLDLNDVQSIIGDTTRSYAAIHEIKFHDREALYYVMNVMRKGDEYGRLAGRKFSTIEGDWIKA